MADPYEMFKSELSEVLKVQTEIDTTQISEVAAQVLRDLFGGADVHFPIMTKIERLDRDNGIRQDFPGLGLDGTKSKYNCGSSTIYRALNNQPRKRGRRR